MEYNDFIEIIPQIKSAKLLGIEAHKIMAPTERLLFMEDFDYSLKNPRESAVLCLFYPKENQVYMALIIRAKYPGVHASQVAFPGGKREEGEELDETALRETFEEIGVSPSKVSLIKELTKVYIPPSNFLVTPFVGYADELLEFTKDPYEVADVIELSLNTFLNDEIVSKITMDTSYANTTKMPVFTVEEHLVWGATAMIMSEIKEMIKKIIN